MNHQNQRYFAELIGTFALVFVGAGAVIANTLTGGAVGLLGIALAHGLILMAMIYALGNTSGAHFNPAVTIAMVFSQKMRAKTGLAYIVFQLIGSILAALALYVVFPATPMATQLGAPIVNSSLGVTLTLATLIEVILTFFLVFTIYGVAIDKKNSTPVIGLAIGLVLALSILLGGAFTGGALNPARAFGPHMVSKYLTVNSFDAFFYDQSFWIHHLVYWIGPIVGALAAAIIYTSLFMPDEKRMHHKKSKKTAHGVE